MLYVKVHLVTLYKCAFHIWAREDLINHYWHFNVFWMSRLFVGITRFILQLEEVALVEGGLFDAATN